MSKSPTPAPPTVEASHFKRRHLKSAYLLEA